MDGNYTLVVKFNRLFATTTSHNVTGVVLNNKTHKLIWIKKSAKGFFVKYSYEQFHIRLPKCDNKLLWKGEVPPRVKKILAIFQGKYFL